MHWPWSHRWETIRVEHFDKLWWDRKLDKFIPMGDATTHVYQKCACGATQMRKMAGTWNLEDLQ